MQKPLARRSLLTLGIGIALLLAAMLLSQPRAHAAQIPIPLHPPCVANGCDNIDPYGQCHQIEADGSCAQAFQMSETPAPGSCQALGTRLAVNHLADRSAAIKTITSFTGETIATEMLVYSDVCKSNWIEILLQGPCAATTTTPSPCSVYGSMNRTRSNQQDGNNRFVTFLPQNPSGTAHTAMLYTPDVPVAGCVSVVYPQNSEHLSSPFVCITQAGYQL
jgi:hypothetical protein